MENYTARLFMAGDCLIHGAVYNDAAVGDGTYDFTEQFEALGRLAQNYDLRYYNQETVLGGTELGLSSYPMFNSPQEVGEAMVANGFNLVSLANNHSLDRSDTGVQKSLEFWDAQEGVVTAGMNASWEDRETIEVHEVNGISYAFLSWTYGTNGLVAPSGEEYLVNVYTDHEEEMLEQVRTADEMADVVIIAMHWGVEYTHTPTDEELRLSQELADAGADIIIGAHPHVIQPVSYLNDGSTICYYSLGNMISAQIDEPTLIEMYGAVTINKTVIDGETTITLENASADLMYDYYTSNYRNFKAIPFRELTDDLVPGYEALYEKYVGIITQMDDSIQVGVES